MTEHGRGSAPRRQAPLRSGVHYARRTSTLLGLSTLIGFGAIDVLSAPQQRTPTENLGMTSGPLEEMMAVNRCSPTGFDRDVEPSRAIVRTSEGDTRLVSFEQGWAVFSGEVAGKLVAVCLGPEVPPPAQSPD